jgi:FMN phosphatase YigB (HAD superfamily)
LLDDVSGARAVGMRTVLTHQFRQEHDDEIAADARVGHLRELPPILAEWGGDGRRYSDSSS